LFSHLLCCINFIYFVVIFYFSHLGNTEVRNIWQPFVAHF
jgi:hypothetical protein